MQNILIGTRKGLFIYEKQTQGWTLAKKEFLGVPVNIVATDPRDESIYAVLLHGHFGTKVHRSTDNGQTWTEIATPQYPSDLPKEKLMSPEPDDEEWYQPKLEKIWSLTPGHASQPDVLWCGTIPGGLFKSTDKGNSWELVRSLWDREERKQWFGGGEDYAGLHSICVHPNDPNDVIIGVSCGGAWHTPDGGETWQVRSTGMFAEYMPPDQRDNPIFQDPHRVVQCQNNPDVLWTQHHNGVFASQDRGLNWSHIENLTPSAFGFAVCIHPHDPNTVWLVPAEKDEMRIPVDGKVIVNKTTDGGKTWKTIRTGLPQTDAYDIVFRHALDCAADGNTLAFGSTTGNVWVSEDQGDSWATLSNYLPPVYCITLT